MWLMIVTSTILVVWAWLPEITIALKFCTALIGFVIAVHTLVQRTRWWLRQRRRR